MYKLKSCERETTIRWDMEGRMATIDTADAAMIRKLDKLAAAHPETFQCIRKDEVYQAKSYQVPSRYIRFGKPASQAKRDAARKSLHTRSENAVITGALAEENLYATETPPASENPSHSTYTYGLEG